MVMMCCSPELHSCYPFIFACPFILMAMHTLFLIYQTDAPENYMMNIGYFIGIASLFYYPSVFLIIWVLLSLLIFKFREVRLFLIPIMGFMLINALLLGISFMFGKYDMLIDSYSHFFRNIAFSVELTSVNKILLIISGVLFLVSVLRTVGSQGSDKGTNVRKRVGVSFLLAVFAVIIFFMQKPLMNNALIFMMFAMFYAMALSDIRKSKIANAIMVVFLILVIANQYLPLFGITI